MQIRVRLELNVFFSYKESHTINKLNNLNREVVMGKSQTLA